MYSIGDIVQARITNIVHYGFFFEVDNSAKGLVHISEISNKYVYNPADYFEIGQEVTIYIMSYDEKLNQIKGSYRKIAKKDFDEKTFDSKKEFEILKKQLQPIIKSTLKKIKENL